jgi:hypothetical protein
MAVSYRRGRWVDVSSHLQASRECALTRK